MQRLARSLLPLVAAPFLASCVFLLDYDELQHHPTSPGSGGAQGGEGASAAGVAGEAGGASGSCGDCNDHDPCTIDTCDDQTGDTPLCTHEATQGLQLDGFETTLTSPEHVRVSVVAGGQQFYFAALENQKGGPKVSLYRLASDGAELESIAGDLRLEGAPVSNVGLAVEELALGEVALHGFVATKLKVGNATAKVFHIENRSDTTTSNVVGASYAEGNQTVFPQALLIGDNIVGAWIQADGTLAVHDVGAARTDTFGSTSLPATTLSLLSTADDEPAVLFAAQSGPQQALGTYVATSAQEPTQLGECETRAGDYVSSSVIGTQIPGLWLANVTRAGDKYLTTGAGTLVCDNNACAAVGEDCAGKSANGTRNLAGATVRFEADPPGIVYSVLALPQLAAKADDASAIEGKLSLVLGQTNFAAKGKPTSMPIGGGEGGLMLIARNDTDEASGFAGPDWPAVAILPTKQVAVAWIQPNPAADGTELHVQRYKMCLAEP